MSEIKINLPKLGESIVSATVVKWFKKVGDLVALDEPLLEVSTDKVNSEIPSPAKGVLKEILALEDIEVAVGAPLAILSAEAVAIGTSEEPKQEITRQETGTDDFLSPAVMRLIQEKGIPLSDIDKIPRQGARLTKKDVDAYCAPCPLNQEGTERIKMSGLRKAIAENMVRSFYEAPHASLTTEVDVTDLMKKIQDKKQPFFDEHGVKLSITAFVARGIARAVKEFPLVNASLDRDTIVVKKFVNLGVAVSVDQGVMVPVIRNAEDLSIVDFAKQINSLAKKARENALEPDDVKEGSITMTNFGITGVALGSPIIRYPEVAIIGLGAIAKKVMVMPDDSTAIRSIMWVSVTFDHRVLDGLYGCGFLNALKKNLETQSD